MKNYYMIIPADNIYIKNNEKNVTILDGASAKSIFEKYNVPSRYQKIVLKLLLEEEMLTAKELITGSIYEGRENLIKILLNPKKEVYLDSLDNLIETLSKLSTSEDIKELFLNIIKDDLASNYIKAIKEVYRYQVKENEIETLRKIKRNEYIH